MSDYDLDDDDNLFDFDDEVDPFSAPHVPSHKIFNSDISLSIVSTFPAIPRCH